MENVLDEVKAKIRETAAKSVALVEVGVTDDEDGVYVVKEGKKYMAPKMDGRMIIYNRTTDPIKKRARWKVIK